MSTYNICFPGEIRKLLSGFPIIRSMEYTDRQAGPSCSKLTMSLVNDSLKFASSDMQIC